MEQIREEVLGDGLKGNYRERGWHRVSSRDLNTATDEAFTISSGNLLEI